MKTVVVQFNLAEGGVVAYALCLRPRNYFSRFVVTANFPHMLSYKQALALAEAWLRICVRGEVQILEDQVIKKPYGWVFFYQSTAFQSGEPHAQLAGNAPLLIDRCNGELRVTGTARKLSEYLAAYESTLPKARLEMAPSSD